jgi:NADH dehydrogenase (ubiquinone) 1 alpha subcomplex subunit 5
MRSALRLLASVKPARYLEAGYMTGLTGLYTHPSPRMTLLYLYSSTIEKLKALPESSLYRQSVEALTKHRMTLVDEMVPPGYKEWKAKADKILLEHPDQFMATSGRPDGSSMHKVVVGDRTFVLGTQHKARDIRTEEWDGETDEGPELEGSRTPEERKDQILLAERTALDDTVQVDWEPEPPLTADQ